MGPFHIEKETISVHVQTPEDAGRAGFLIDTITAKPGSNPAKPDAEGNIVREIAPDVMRVPGYLEELLIKAGVEVIYGPPAP